MNVTITALDFSSDGSVTLDDVRLIWGSDTCSVFDVDYLVIMHYVTILPENQGLADRQDFTCVPECSCDNGTPASGNDCGFYRA